MSVELSQGSQIAFGNALATSKIMSAITNATEAVATLEATHGILVGDVFKVATSGWQLMQSLVVRAKTVAVNDVTLERFSTVSTSRFPTGEGVGTVQEVSGFTTITQIKEVDAQTPGINFVEITNLADLVKRQVPGLEDAAQMNFVLQYDSSLSWWDSLLGFSDSNTPMPMRITTPSLKKIYVDGYWKMSRVPLLRSGAEITHGLVFVFNNLYPSSYAS